VLREDVEVCIPVEDWYGVVNRHGSCQTIDELAHCVTPLATGSVECRCCLIVHRLHRKGGCSGEEAAQSLKMLFVVGASEHFHSNYVAGGDLGRQQVIHSLTDGRIGIA
jgi:hypothetical protein